VEVVYPKVPNDFPKEWKSFLTLYDRDGGSLKGKN
jgi:hypothetical protein